MKSKSSQEFVNILELCAIRSEAKIKKMRELAYREFETDSSFVIGVNGSYARREATKGSDVDLSSWPVAVI